MLLEVGDMVVHPVYGVGRIKTLVKRQFAGEEARQFYEVTAKDATIWVPVNDLEVIGLRLLTPKTDLAKCRSLLRSRPVALSKDHQKRRHELASRLKRGSLQARCEVVRDLTALRWQKRLTLSEDTLLKKTSAAVFEEWAASNGVTTARAIQEIESLLLEAQRARAS
jgi:CarD family transcriptional regulator